MSKKNKKKQLGSTSEGEFVYSTNSNFAFEGLADLLGKSKENEGGQLLEVHLEKKHRGGKTAVIIKGFTGSDEELQALAKKLKSNIGTGGSAKEGEIIIQGDQRQKVMDLLQNWGYKTKRIGG